MTSHLHPAISPALASRREYHQRQADAFEQFALYHEQQADALRGSINYPAAKRAQQHAADGRRYRRAVRDQLAAATTLTDWRDELDKRDSSWAARLCHLVEAPRPAVHFA